MEVAPILPVATTPVPSFPGGTPTSEQETVVPFYRLKEGPQKRPLDDDGDDDPSAKRPRDEGPQLARELIDAFDEWRNFIFLKVKDGATGALVKGLGFEITAMANCGYLSFEEVNGKAMGVPTELFFEDIDEDDPCEIAEGSFWWWVDEGEWQLTRAGETRRVQLRLEGEANEEVVIIVN